MVERMQRLVCGGVKAEGGGAGGKSPGEPERAEEQEKLQREMQRIRLREPRGRSTIAEGKRENSPERAREKTQLQREKERIPKEPRNKSKCRGGMNEFTRVISLLVQARIDR
jgi:hypothetical protein